MDMTINMNIPTPSERHIASHDFCLPITLMVKNIETKIRETVEETKLKHALSAESPDIKELTALVRQVPHPEIYEKSLLEEFDLMN